MGFRLRRSIKILPGIKLNINKSRLGLSMGVKGYHVSVGPSGVRRTISIPGTGISHVEQLKAPLKKSSTTRVDKQKSILFNNSFETQESKQQIASPFNSIEPEIDEHPPFVPLVNTPGNSKSSSLSIIPAAILGVVGCLFLGGLPFLITSLVSPTTSAQPTISVENVVSTSMAQYTQQAIVAQMFQQYTQTAQSFQKSEQQTRDAQAILAQQVTLQPTLPMGTGTPTSEPTVAVIPTLAPAQFVEIPTEPIGIYEPALVSPVEESTQENPLCCKTCKSGKACGDSCISADKICSKPPGCACDG
jgi:hypothetical protein